MQFDFDILKEYATRSVPLTNHWIGAALVCEHDKCYYGFTIKRSTVIGSTCAERMALDNWYQDSEKTTPVKLILIGKIRRDGWNDNHICFPCGVCRELYHQFLYEYRLAQNFTIECYSWNQELCQVNTIRELLYYGTPFYEKESD